MGGAHGVSGVPRALAPPERVASTPRWRRSARCRVAIEGRLSGARGRAGGRARGPRRHPRVVESADREGLCGAAASAGRLDALRWMRARGYPWGDASGAAAEGGHLELLQWAIRRQCPVNRLCCRAAYGGGPRGAAVGRRQVPHRVRAAVLQRRAARPRRRPAVGRGERPHDGQHDARRRRAGGPARRDRVAARERPPATPAGVRLGGRGRPPGAAAVAAGARGARGASRPAPARPARTGGSVCCSGSGPTGARGAPP